MTLEDIFYVPEIHEHKHDWKVSESNKFFQALPSKLLEFNVHKSSGFALDKLES